MSSVNPISSSDLSLIASQISANDIEATSVSDAELSASSTQQPISAQSAYLAGEEDLSEIAIQAGSSSPSKAGGPQSSAYTQLANNNPSAAAAAGSQVPSPMDLVTQTQQASNVTVPSPTSAI